MTTRPVAVNVSQATRLEGSSVRQASRIASEIWSAILSGCPSVTDSLVNKKRSRLAKTNSSIQYLTVHLARHHLTPIFYLSGLASGKAHTRLLLWPTQQRYPALNGNSDGFPSNRLYGINRPCRAHFQTPQPSAASETTIIATPIHRELVGLCPPTLFRRTFSANSDQS